MKLELTDTVDGVTVSIVCSAPGSTPRLRLMEAMLEILDLHAMTGSLGDNEPERHDPITDVSGVAPYARSGALDMLAMGAIGESLFGESIVESDFSFAPVNVEEAAALQAREQILAHERENLPGPSGRELTAREHLLLDYIVQQGHEGAALDGAENELVIRQLHAGVPLIETAGDTRPDPSRWVLTHAGEAVAWRHGIVRRYAEAARQLS